jgi:uncharacterized membrane protein YcaP (DUF421 family)
MDFFGPVELGKIFLPSTPLLEIIMRGSIMYLTLFSMLRLVLKRVAGTIGMADLLMVVLIADAAQNALSADYRSITDGVILVITIVFWNYALDWIGFRFPRFQRFFHPPPLPLVRDGQLLRRNMRQELITIDELMSQLRQQGIEDLAQVKSAAIEGDGRISVVAYHEQLHGASSRRTT